MPRKKSNNTVRKPSSQIRQVLAENILAFRRSQALSQEELAEICGLHRTYVGSVERAERNVTLSTLEVFAAALGVSVPRLLSTESVEDNCER